MRKPQKILLGVLWLIALASLTGFVLLKVAQNEATAQAAAPQTYFAVPPFSLTNQYGQEVTNKTLAGQPYVMGLFFSTCGDACPMLTEHLQYVQKALGESPARIVRITVDPEFDTPERLAGYAEATAADPGRLHLLTGETDEVFEVIGGFRIAAGRRVGDELPTHGNTFLLVDGHGNVRGTYDGLAEEEMANLLSDIRRLTN